MSVSNENGNSELQQVFIRAVTDDGTARDLELSCIKRVDEVRGRMRLLFNDGEHRHFYFVPDLSYAQAREKIAGLPETKFIDLANC